jgi:GMP reductase
MKSIRESDFALDFEHVLIVPQKGLYRPPPGVVESRKRVELHDKDGRIPIFASNMRHTGTFEMAEALAKRGLQTILNKHYTRQEIIDWVLRLSRPIDILKHVGVSRGTSSSEVINVAADFKDFEAATGLVPRYLCFDIANGYGNGLASAVRQARNLIDMHGWETEIIAGNVVTLEGVLELQEAGADWVKVGIGSGSVCTTRIKTGVGFPQASALAELDDAEVTCKILSDGGCNNPGDVAKAFALGAHGVMLGGMFAGHVECDGKVLGNVKMDRKLKDCVVKIPQNTINPVSPAILYSNILTGQTIYDDFGVLEVINVIPEDWYDYKITDWSPDTYMMFYGSASQFAEMVEGAEHRDYRTFEGKEVQVPFKGYVDNTINDILGGLRSTLTYTGCQTINDLIGGVRLIPVMRHHNTVFGA